ncbi:MAG: Uma2 family endonuclease, partial [SAR324 cluster bacterium]|nr:Uma2 family endonuclease [SAR324 cluster bacterium]
DLAGWCRERLPKIPETAYFELALDWVCEVLSPSTARTARVLKLPIYVKFGVAHCWLADPKIKLLEAFVLQDGQWTLLGSYGGNDEIRVAPFDAITFPLSALWAE